MRRRRTGTELGFASLTITTKPVKVSVPATAWPFTRVRCARARSSPARSDDCGLTASSVPSFRQVLPPGSVVTPASLRER